MKTAEGCMLSAFKNKRFLFFFPHEDDEVNIAGSLLLQLSKIDSVSRIVYSTNGEYYISPDRRKREAKNALKLCDIRESDIVFLGFPDVITEDDIFFDRDYQINRIKEQISDFNPDYIVTNDRDSHPNHRELSDLIDESIEQIAEFDSAHCPIVLKTYAYDLGYFSVDDYSRYNLRSTIRPRSISNPSFVWDERLRLPVPQEMRTPLLEQNHAFKMLWRHHSQSAFKAAGKVANSDKVYWVSAKDNLLCSDHDDCGRIWFLKICYNDEYIYDYYSSDSHIKLDVIAYDHLGKRLEITNRVIWKVDGKTVSDSNVKLGRKRTTIEAICVDDPAIRDTVRVIRHPSFLTEILYSVLSSVLGRSYIIADWVINEFYRFVSV